MRNASRELLDNEANETIENVISQLRHLLASTVHESKQIFYQLLANEAKLAFRYQRFDQALSIYQLLENEDAGDFHKEIQEINQRNDVQAYLDQMHQEQEYDYRLVILQDAWKKYPDYPSLRRSIHDEVYQSAIGRGHFIQASLEQGESTSAFQAYEEWSSLVWPLSDGWKQADKTSATVWEVRERLS